MSKLPEENKQTQKTVTKETEDKKSNKTLIIILSAAVGLFVLAVVGNTIFKSVTQKAVEQAAEKALESAIEQSAEGSVDVDFDLSDEGQEITIETEEGTFTAGQQEIPDNFPKDFPTYPGATITSTASSPDNIALILISKDSVAKAADYFEDELVDNGWLITSTSTIENATIYAVEKGNMTGAVIINETEEGTQITIDVKFESEG